MTDGSSKFNPETEFLLEALEPCEPCEPWRIHPKGMG